MLASASRHMMPAAETAEAIRYGREALAIAEQLGLDEVRANALINIGVVDEAAALALRCGQTHRWRSA